MSTMDKVYYGIATIVVLLVVGSVAWLSYVMYLGPKMHVQPALAATPLPRTRVPTVRVPTSTPKATSTPRPPTVTPILPTAIPPTAVHTRTLSRPVPEISYEEAAYILAVGDAPGCFADAEVELKLLMQEMGRNLYVRGDRSWQKDVAIAKASFLECLQRLKELDPPPRLADTHADLVRCGGLCFSAAYDGYMFAIEKLLPEAMEYGDTQMEHGAACFEQVFDEIGEIVGQ